MEALVSALPYAEITLSILLIVGIVLQRRGATLGGAFGGDNFASTFYKRRGAEKFLFNATILIAVLLVLGFELTIGSKPVPDSFNRRLNTFGD